MVNKRGRAPNNATDDTRSGNKQYTSFTSHAEYKPFFCCTPLTQIGLSTGNINLQRSYEICNSVIANSPNFNRLTDQIKLPPEHGNQMEKGEIGTVEAHDASSLSTISAAKKAKKSVEPVAAPRVIVKVYTNSAKVLPHSYHISFNTLCTSIRRRLAERCGLPRCRRISLSSRLEINCCRSSLQIQRI